MKKRYVSKKKWLAVLLAAFLILGTVSFGAVGFADEQATESTEAPKPPSESTPAPADPSKPTLTPTPTAPPESGETSAPSDPEAPTAPPEQGETEAPPSTETSEPGSSETTPKPENPPGNTDAPGTPGTGTTPAPENPSEKEDPLPDLEDQSPDPVGPAGDLVLKPKEDKFGNWTGVVPSDEQGMPIPILYQTDYPTIVCTIRGLPRSVASSGCGATSASMIIAYLTGNTEQTPYTLFYEAVQTGRYQGAGLDHNTLIWLLNKYGVHGKWIYNDAKAIRQALEEGKPVMAHMGPGIFTRMGHYVVLRGIASDGKVLLNDPISPFKTHRKFPMQTLLNEAKNSHAFMVCWVDDMSSVGVNASTVHDKNAPDDSPEKVTKAPEPTPDNSIDSAASKTSPDAGLDKTSPPEPKETAVMPKSKEGMEELAKSV